MPNAAVAPLKTALAGAPGQTAAVAANAQAELGKVGNEADTSMATMRADMEDLRQREQQIPVEREQQLRALGPAPQMPDQQFHHQLNPKDFQEAGSTMMVLSILGGALTGAPMTAAMGNMAGAIRGYVQGDQAKAQQEYQQFKDNFQLGKERFDEYQKRYNDIVNNAKGDLQQIQSEIRILNAEYGTASQLRKAQQDNATDMMKTMAGANQGYATIAKALEVLGKAINAQGVGSPGNIQASAAMAATGMPLNQVVSGYGTAAVQQRSAVRDAAIELIKSENPGMTNVQAGAEFARRQIGFGAEKRSVGQLTVMKGATLAAIKQLNKNVDKVTELEKETPGSDISPVVNAIARGVDRWTGDPKYSTLFYYMYGAATESARILSGGQASTAQLHQGAADEAKKWADANWITPRAWIEGIAPAMKNEAQFRIESFDDSIAEMEGGGGPTKTQPTKITSDADYDALPSGAEFIAPDGSHRRKP